MTPSDIELLKVYVLLSPALVFALALAVVWLTPRLDAWADRRKATNGPSHLPAE